MSLSIKEDEIFENDESFENVNTPDKYDIDNEEWYHLVNTDTDLAAQVGIFLLERSKDLEMIITSTESCLDEQTARANHFEKQVDYLRETLESQTRAYENFERQVEELTKSYREISDECLRYKDKNNTLWKTVETLEATCEEYMSEIHILKSKQICSDCEKEPTEEDTTRKTTIRKLNTSVSFDKIMEERAEIVNDSEIISLRAYSEDISRKLDLERSLKLNVEFKLSRAIEENVDLNNQLSWLEYRLNNEFNNSENKMPLKKLQAADKLSKSRSMISLKDDNDQNKVESKKISQLIPKECYVELGNPITPAVSNMALKCETRPDLTVSKLLERMKQPSVDSECDSLSKEIIEANESENQGNDVDSQFSQRICHSCGQTKPYIKQVVNPTNKLQSDRPGSTLSNYRSMFAEIFEKLKVSREIINTDTNLTP